MYKYEVDLSRIPNADKKFYHIEAMSQKDALKKVLELYGQPQLLNNLIWKLDKLVRLVDPNIKGTIEEEQKDINLFYNGKEVNIKGVEDINIGNEYKEEVYDLLGKKAVNAVYTQFCKNAIRSKQHRVILQIIEGGEERDIIKGDWTNYDEAEKEGKRAMMEEQEPNKMTIAYVEDIYGNIENVEGVPVEGSSYGPEVRDQRPEDIIKYRPTGSNVFMEPSSWSVPKKASKKLSWRCKK